MGTKLAVSMLPTLEPPPPVSWMLKQEANQILWPPSHRSDQCPSPSMPLVLHSSCITQVFTMKRDQQYSFGPWCLGCRIRNRCCRWRFLDRQELLGSLLGRRWIHQDGP